MSFPESAEWLEADGLGGFASGTVSGQRTRRYHALLLVATTPPVGRMVLVNGCEVIVKTPGGTFPLSTQRYTPDVVYPDGRHRIESFSTEPWPRWIFALEDGTRIEHELFAVHGRPLVAMAWRLLAPAPGVRLLVRPLLSGRDYHHLHQENPNFRFTATVSGQAVRWSPYPGVPPTTTFSNGQYKHDPTWYRNFLYLNERQRGLDCTEDLASPGRFLWDLSSGQAVWVLGAESLGGPWPDSAQLATRWFAELKESEAARRAAFATPVARAADSYLVAGRRGTSIIAGYPWFTDWGRDTFIALRGLCLATGWLDRARDILLGWAGAVSEGMLPNRFPDQGEEPEYNSVDASLWFIVAAGELLTACAATNHPLSSKETARLQAAIVAILTGYRQGTRYGIRLDVDGLLACGEPGTQLTWMDARVGGVSITPRVGKPVEIQALWLNALAIAARFDAQWQPLFDQGLQALRNRFWNHERQMLFDVVDVKHQPGTVDGSLRPNQIFAVGGLPLMLLEGRQAEQVVAAVEQNLWTPAGPRSLAPTEQGYAPRCVGGPAQRDSTYHQGTVWPWLAGAFIEAWVRTRGSSVEAKAEARHRFLTPLQERLQQWGLGHLSEIADADSPHAPRGCPFQAWSLGELIRVDRQVLGEA